MATEDRVRCLSSSSLSSSSSLRRSSTVLLAAMAMLAMTAAAAVVVSDDSSNGANGNDEYDQRKTEMAALDLHVVVLMLENRAFDHMAGFLKRHNAEIDGLLGNESNPYRPSDPHSSLVSVDDHAPYINVNPGHSYDGRQQTARFKSADYSDTREMCDRSLLDNRCAAHFV